MLRTFIDTTNVEDNRCGPRQKASKVKSGERLCYKYAAMHKAVNLKKPGTSQKAKGLRSIRGAKTNGEAHYDRSSE